MTSAIFLGNILFELQRKPITTPSCFVWLKLVRRPLYMLYISHLRCFHVKRKQCGEHIQSRIVKNRMGKKFIQKVHNVQFKLSLVVYFDMHVRHLTTSTPSFPKVTRRGKECCRCHKLYFDSVAHCTDFVEIQKGNFNFVFAY